MRKKRYEWGERGFPLYDGYFQLWKKKRNLKKWELFQFENGYSFEFGVKINHGEPVIRARVYTNSGVCGIEVKGDDAVSMLEQLNDFVDDAMFDYGCKPSCGYLQNSKEEKNGI